jgi:hypothetical protein
VVLVAVKQFPPRASQYRSDLISEVAANIFAARLPDLACVVTPTFIGASVLLLGGVPVGVVQAADMKLYPAKKTKDKITTIIGRVVVFGI